MSPKTGGPGRPVVDSELVRSRLPRELLDELDRFANDTSTDRPEAVRRAVSDWRKSRVSGIEHTEGVAAVLAILITAPHGEDRLEWTIKMLVESAEGSPNPGVRGMLSAVLEEVAKLRSSSSAVDQAQRRANGTDTTNVARTDEVTPMISGPEGRHGFGFSVSDQRGTPLVTFMYQGKDEANVARDKVASAIETVTAVVPHR